MLNLFQKQDIFDENERTFYYIRNIAVLYFFLYLVVFGTMLFPHFSEGILCGREEIQDCYFIKYRADTNLWSKIYKTYLLKLAHSKMEDFYFLFCNDTYADYYIAYYAKTMYFISTEPLYIYYYGRGGCGKSEISLEKFEKFCRAKQAADRIRKFVKSEESLEEQEKYILGWEKHIQNYCCGICFKRVNPEEFTKAIKILYKYFNEKNDTREIITHSLKELRNHINWAANLEKTNKNLLAKMNDVFILQYM